MNYRQAVIDFCMSCREGDEWAVGNCEKVDCKLYSVRPNQRLKGTLKDDFDLDSCEQQVLDQLKFGGLKTLLRKD